MKKFVAILSRKNKPLFSGSLLAKHVEHLQNLKDNGVLILCGPFTDNDSAMQIIFAKDMASAESSIASDPFVSQHYYEKVVVKELIEANPENNWLTKDPQTEKNRMAVS